MFLLFLYFLPFLFRQIQHFQFREYCNNFSSIIFGFFSGFALFVLLINLFSNFSDTLSSNIFFKIFKFNFCFPFILFFRCFNYGLFCIWIINCCSWNIFVIFFKLWNFSSFISIIFCYFCIFFFSVLFNMFVDILSFCFWNPSNFFQLKTLR